MAKNNELGSELCQKCGLCCSGALFSNVPIQEGEEEKIKEIGLTSVKNYYYKFVFKQPCANLIDSRCSVYQNRPFTCSDYSCDLYFDVIDGEVPFDVAKDAVISAKEQIKWLCENATRNEDEDGSAFNLRDYLHSFLAEMIKKYEQETIKQMDMIYAIKAYNYLKLINGTFRKTKLFEKYGQLVKTIHSDQVGGHE